MARPRRLLMNGRIIPCEDDLFRLRGYLRRLRTAAAAASTGAA